MSNINEILDNAFNVRELLIEIEDPSEEYVTVTRLLKIVEMSGRELLDMQEAIIDFLLENKNE